MTGRICLKRLGLLRSRGNYLLRLASILSDKIGHPLEGFSVGISNLKSFGSGPEQITFSPINILIGRNNSGKSSFYDALELLQTSGASYVPEIDRQGNRYKIEVSQILLEGDLKRVFSPNVSRGGVPGPNHWEYGRKFVGQRVIRSFQGKNERSFVKGPDFKEIPESERPRYLTTLAGALPDPMVGIPLYRIAAERDVSPEPSSSEWLVEPNGRGLTNAVRAFLNDERLPRDEIDVGLLADLNTIFKGDNHFTRIITRENDKGEWEIFLEEDTKSFVRLSRSGSGLKSIFTFLAAMRLNPIISEKELAGSVFFLEEPENNLHPALLRRLLNFVSKFREAHNMTIFITTHSPVGIDWASRRNDCGIIHVFSTTEGSVARSSINYESTKRIIEDLDIRASEILQANGVIWVEGPSDRIYLNRWIELISDGTLIEGVDYAIMFYGGKLLSHVSAANPDKTDSAISLLKLNRNCAIVIDSDRKWLKKGTKRRFRAHINATKRRLLKESTEMGGFVWITEGKEVENYIQNKILASITKSVALKIDKFDGVFDNTKVTAVTKSKVNLAHMVVEQTALEHLSVLDLRDQLERLCQTIKGWNGD